MSAERRARDPGRRRVLRRRTVQRHCGNGMDRRRHPGKARRSRTFLLGAVRDRGGARARLGTRALLLVGLPGDGSPALGRQRSAAGSLVAKARFRRGNRHVRARRRAGTTLAKTYRDNVREWQTERHEDAGGRRRHCGFRGGRRQVRRGATTQASASYPSMPTA